VNFSTGLVQSLELDVGIDRSDTDGGAIVLAENVVE